MKKAIIMRGIPGSGKSTYVDQNYPHNVVCSADRYFIKECPDCACGCPKCGNTGFVYNYNPNKLDEAHAQCLRFFVNSVTNNITTNIVVDNTNISAVEIAPYASLARAYGLELEILTLKIDPEVAWSRNIHGVPRSTCIRRYKQMEHEETRFPKYWNHKVIG